MHSVYLQRPRVACLNGAQRRSLNSRALPQVKCVAADTQTKQAKFVEQPGRQEAVLCTKFKAHDAAVTALAVLRDEPGFKQIVTASLDKSLAVWTLEGGDLNGPQLQCSRMEVPGGPVFSLQRGIKTKITDVNAKPREPVLFCGTAAKEITALRPDTLTFSQQMRMNGHTGWVRSLASTGKYLFSCGCNHLHQWDQAYAVPKEVRSMSLFTGDILALAATDKAVFTAGADGSLRRWALGKLGELSEAEVRDKAHDGRITALAVSGSLLFSAGYDGDIKAWDVSSLQLVMEVKGAHAGERVRSLAMGPAPPSSKASTPSSSPRASPGHSPPASPAPVATSSLVEEPLQCFEAGPEQQHQHQQAEAQHLGEQPLEGMPALDDLAPVPELPAHTAAAEQASKYEPVADLSPAPAAVVAAAAVTAADVASEYEPVPDPVPAAATAAEVASEYEPVPDPAAVVAAVTAAEVASEYEPVPDPVPVVAAATATDVASEYEPVPDAIPVQAAAADVVSEYEPVPELTPAAPAMDGACELEPVQEHVPAVPTPATAAAASPGNSPASSRPSSPSRATILYSAGDDGLVRRWDARLLTPAGDPLTVHHSAVKALAVGEHEVLVSGDASGEVAVWLL